MENEELLNVDGYDVEDLTKDYEAPIHLKFKEDKELASFIKFRIADKIEKGILWTAHGYRYNSYFVDWTQNTIMIFYHGNPDW